MSKRREKYYFCPPKRTFMPTNSDSDKNELDGRTKLLRFGLLLNEEQQEIVVERIKELCVEGFGK